MSHSYPEPDVPASQQGQAPAEEPPQWRSEELLRGSREALIVHEGEVYRLRCTRNGKLILQK